MSKPHLEEAKSQNFFHCRICWSVALVTFAAILAVEAVILVPSYKNFGRDWQNRYEQQALFAVQAVLASHPDAAAESITGIYSAFNTLVENGVLLGWTLHSPNDGFMLASGGSTPYQLIGKPSTRFLSDTPQGEVLDVTWSQEQLGVPYRAQVRIDMQSLAPALRAFLWRIIGLIALISLFVTAVTMVVVHRYLLKPLLNLHAHATKAGDKLSYYNAVIENIRPNNELGQVIAAFNSMLRRVADSIRNASFDDLTHLPNRSLGTDRLKQAIELAKRGHYSGALMFIDIDNFKEINDTMGHEVGDDLLMQTSKRLSDALRGSDSVTRLTTNEDQYNDDDIDWDNDIVARIGGDEFMVVLPELAEEDDASIVAYRLSQSCSSPFYVNGHEIAATVSIGIALFPRDGADSKALMMSADTALYSVKDSGRNGYRFFSTEMNSRLIERLEIESRLRHALERNEFILHYQPVVNVKTQRITGVEALLRWQNEQLGAVAPDRFIPIAESLGLINDIGDWVLNQSCTVAKQLNDDGLSLRIAVNVSTRQFRGVNFVRSVSDVLKSTQLPADKLELEITESLLVDDSCEASETINRLRNMGVRLSIDDFGTGYSALSYLRSFNVNTLKIDRSFVAAVVESEKDASLALTIIDMAKNFGLEIVAEGVEEKTQLDFLSKHDCDFAQGYYFGKPMPYEELVTFLATSKAV